MRRSDPEDGSDAPILIVGLGNPGREYERSRHNAGFMVAALLAERWDLPRAKDKFNARITEGRIRPGGPRVVLMTPLTYMNESGKSAGPARGSKKIPLDRVIAVYDEIDLPFGEIRNRLGGGAAGHNGVKSLKQGFGSADFWRVRIGVDRPDSTDPDRVAGYVLGKFSESREQVENLIDDAARETERLVERIAAGETGEN
ncbi:MAG: aminoacyl-tRNA hydrolase [Solirubrobacterales bacterium]|nr:aminoacyl-tRNA hydrolase [Solirubrobacterales bacterium]